MSGEEGRRQTATCMFCGHGTDQPHKVCGPCRVSAAPLSAGRSSTVSNVDVWGYYDGILSGTLDYAGHTGCRFELASECSPLGDEPRHYIVLRRGKVIGRVTESELNAARTSDDASEPHWCTNPTCDAEPCNDLDHRVSDAASPTP